MNKAIIKADILHFQVTDRLRDMIVSGEMEPGDSISEKDLCQHFGISRTPLREALKVLASAELIDLLPRRGAVVSPISVEGLAERFVVVQMIEAHAAEALCADARPEDIESLEDIADRIESLIAKEQVGRYFEASGEFHRRLVELTGNRPLIRIHSDLLHHLIRARLIALRYERNYSDLIRSHRSIVRAIKRKNPGAARQAATDHLIRVRKSVLATLANQPAADWLRQA